jgi:hypothetical protein
LPRIVLNIAQNDFAALLNKAERRSGAKAAGCAGYRGYFSF